MEPMRQQGLQPLTTQQLQKCGFEARIARRPPQDIAAQHGQQGFAVSHWLDWIEAPAGGQAPRLLLRTAQGSLSLPRPLPRSDHPQR